MIEIRFQDEARIGQKNGITRGWAKRGSRPSAPHDQRTRSVYIFGAICPKHGKAAALVMPWCDTHAMNQHLIEMSRNVDYNANAILIMDQAGCHISNNLLVPENITILLLPPKSPELNPVENIWQFMRENWPSNRIFKSYGGHRRPLLPRLANTAGPPLEDHVNRSAATGQWVLINEAWYYATGTINRRKATVWTNNKKRRANSDAF